MVRGIITTTNFWLVLVYLLIFARPNLSKIQPHLCSALKFQFVHANASFRQDCVIPLKPNEIEVLNNVIDGFLHVFTGGAATPSVPTLSGPSTDDNTWLDREASCDCMHMLVNLRTSLYSILGYFWLAPSCHYTAQRDFEQALKQAEKDFETVMNILCRVDAHSPTNSVERYYETKVSELERVLKDAFAKSECTYNARQCHSPNLSEATTALGKLREDFAQQKTMVGQIEMMREEFFVHAEGLKAFWLIEDMLDVQKTIAPGDMLDRIYDRLLERVRSWSRGKNYMGLANRRVDKASRTEQERLSRKFYNRSEELVLVLTNIEAYASSRGSFAAASSPMSWLEFLQEYFDPVLVKIVSGDWFTLESVEYPGEHLCSPLRTGPYAPEQSDFFSIMKRAPNDDDLRSECSWKLAPIPEDEGMDRLYLINKVNETAETGHFEEKHKVKIRIITPENALQFHNGRAEEPLESFVVAIFLKMAEHPSGKEYVAIRTTGIFYRGSRQIAYGLDDQGSVSDDNFHWFLN